jgi:signal transduction histidine kinase
LNEKEGLNEQVEQVNLNETLDGVLLSIKALIATSKATFHIDFSEVENISFNKVYLESVFLNLITNSIKYAQVDRSPVISISSKKINGISQLIISDNGLGFDMEKVRGKIFGFHQKFHNHIDSKGIGLYLVYNHITGLGGHIAADSTVNAGTTFTISFK